MASPPTIWAPHGFQTCCIVESHGRLSWRQATKEIDSLSHSSSSGGVVVHLLGGDVVIDDGLSVLHGGSVRVTTDEVRWVEMGVGRTRCKVPRQVIGSC